MVQTVEQTHQQQVEMYSKCKKSELIEMLIACNTILQNRNSTSPYRTIALPSTTNYICTHTWRISTSNPNAPMQCINCGIEQIPMSFNYGTNK